MNYSYEGAKTFINTELLKICAKGVRHNTDTSGLEWYSVIDFMIRVCTEKTKKETYKTWDFFKSKSKSKSEIESFTRRVDFTYESIVPLLSLSFVFFYSTNNKLQRILN